MASWTMPLLLFAAPAPQAGDEERERVSLPDTLITPTRNEQPALELPWTTDSVDALQILEQSYRTTPQALRDVPGVMVQETSYGQGSPIIRGFTGFRTVLLIDGIRLNNSVFREGPNQYWSTVDPLSLSRLELVKGVGSVAWGSDAIGGVAQAIGKGPFDFGPGPVSGQLYGRFASADESWVTHADLAGRLGRDTGLYLGLSLKDFDDVRGGSDVGDQPETGYEEWGGDVRLEHRLFDDHRLVLAYQTVEQDDVPRTHATIFAQPFEGSAVGTDLRRDLDHERDLAYVQLHGDDLAGSVERYSASLSWHEQDETQDRIRGNGAQDFQGFDVGTLGAWFDVSTRDTGAGRFTFGVDWYHDDVDSFSSTSPVQGPVADDATYDLLGAFVEDELDVSERLVLTLGVRYDYAAADADSVLDPVTLTETSLEDDWSSFVGRVRFLYRLSEDVLHVFGGISQGFRAPNLSDLTRFDTARSNEFEIPAPGLDSEHYLEYELGLKREGERLSGQVAAFYTDIRDQIVRVPTGNVNSEGDFEITKENAGDGYVYGVEAGADLRVDESWELFGSVAWLQGRVETFPTSDPVKEEEYIDRLMPLMGQLGVRWNELDGRGFVESALRLADDADRLSTRDEQDTQRIPPGGTPSWAVLDLRSGWRLAEHWRLELALENVFDEDYRIHGSGSNMPGRSLIVGLSFLF